MIAIQKILAPVDFSECSNHALKYARELSWKFKAQLHMLYVVPDLAMVMPDSMMTVPNLGPDPNALLQSAEAAVQKHIADQKMVDVISMVRIGSPAETIVEAAKDIGADMIVIGTHGRSGLSQLFLGSVAERVVRSAHCPVLTVRHN